MLTIGMVFWIVMIVWVLFHGYRVYNTPAGQPWPIPDPIAFVLFMLLGIGVFGWPIKG
jgi:hypothetical protein